MSTFDNTNVYELWLICTDCPCPSNDATDSGHCLPAITTLPMRFSEKRIPANKNYDDKISLDFDNPVDFDYTRTRK